MSEEPKKDLKTTAEAAASAAPGAAEAVAPVIGVDAAQAAEKASGKDEGKKKNEDKNKQKEEEKKKKEEEKKKGNNKDKDKDKDKDEKKDKGTDKDEKKDKEKKGKDSGEKKALALPFEITESAILAVAIVVSLTAGSLLGCLLIAPKVIAARNAQPAAPARAERAEGGGEAQEGEGKKGEGKKGEGEKSAVFSIDNIVVNPAGSAGTRFLMASVAFELSDEKAVEALREKEVQIRDAVITTLESQTLEMLAAPGSRDGIKRQLAVAIKPLVPGRKQLRVYLPQFVLQ
jgi:flagellar basal body-associated protein FliL